MLPKMNGYKQRKGGLKKRFYSKVSLPDENGCMKWYSSTNEFGYGTFSITGKSYLATRVMFELVFGDFDSRLEIRHSCHNPICVAPHHLSLGTHIDNMQDKIRAGRDQNQKKTECKHGHSYTIENTAYDKKGARVCRKCAVVRQQKYRAVNADEEEWV